MIILFFSKMVVIIIYLISVDFWCLGYLRGLLASEYCATTNTGYKECVMHKSRIRSHK